MLRYAFGATLIMAVAQAFGGQLAYIVPLLALTFLTPNTKVPSPAQGLAFILVVVVTTGAGFIFTKYFHAYPLFFLPVLGLILFSIFYTVKLGMATKLFLLISFLAMPVPMSGISPTLWAYALNRTLVVGAVFTILMVLTVYAIFPDRSTGTGKTSAAPKQEKAVPTPSERFSLPMEVSLVTFPVVLAFIFFKWSEALLILIYVVVLAMLPSGKQAGIAKVLGNILGGAATIVFYQLIVIVPNFTFFLLLYLGTALLFAGKIFSEDARALLYKTAFSTLTLIIGSAALSTDNANTELLIRIVQVFAAVVYVGAAFAILDTVKTLRVRRKRFFSMIFNRKKS